MLVSFSWLFTFRMFTIVELPSFSSSGAFIPAIAMRGSYIAAGVFGAVHILEVSASGIAVSLHSSCTGKHKIGTPVCSPPCKHTASSCEPRTAGANPRSHAKEQSQCQRFPPRDKYRRSTMFRKSSPGTCCIRFPSKSIRCMDTSPSNVPRGRLDNELLTSDRCFNFGNPRSRSGESSVRRLLSKISSSKSAPMEEKAFVWMRSIPTPSRVKEVVRMPLNASVCMTLTFELPRMRT